MVDSTNSRDISTQTLTSALGARCVLRASRAGCDLGARFAAKDAGAHRGGGRFGALPAALLARPESVRTLLEQAERRSFEISARGHAMRPTPRSDQRGDPRREFLRQQRRYVSLAHPVLLGAASPSRVSVARSERRITLAQQLCGLSISLRTTQSGFERPSWVPDRRIVDVRLGGA
jgi:hypothetical protein